MIIHSRHYGSYFFKDKNGQFYFRIVTPKQLRLKFPNIQKEFRRSLKTTNKHVAKRKAADLCFYMNAKFNQQIENCETLDILIKFISAYLSLEYRSTNSTPEKNRQLILDEFQAFIDSIIEQKGELLKRAFILDIDDLQTKTLKKVKNKIPLLLEMFSDERSDTPIFIKQTIEALKVDINDLIFKTERQFGVLHDSYQAPLATPTEHNDNPSVIETLQNEPTRSNTKQEASYPFSKIAEEFIAEKLKSKNINKKTRNQYLATFGVFNELFNDIDIDIVDAKVCREFKDKIQLYPVRKNSTPHLKDLNFAQIADLKPSSYQTISLETVNKHILRVSTVLEWAIRQGYASKNSMHGMMISIKKSANKDKRHPFDSGDLQKIFTHKVFLRNKFTHPYNFWLPLISMYSGARIQEITQLELDDIREIDSILTFDINDDTDLKKLKNDSSRRLIPVHQKLIDIGLKREIARLRRIKKKYLFPELHTKPIPRDGQHSNASKWFGRFKNSLKLEPKEKKVFHSFRHTFAQSMMTNEVPEHITACLMGHTHEKLTYGTYGGSIDIKILNKHIQLIGYDEIDSLGIRWKAK